jgi:hypothetical protein
MKNLGMPVPALFCKEGGQIIIASATEKRIDCTATKVYH